MAAPHSLRGYRISGHPDNLDEFLFTTEYGLHYVIYASPTDECFRSFEYPSKIFYVGFHRNRAIDFRGDEMQSDDRIMDTVLLFIFKMLMERNVIVTFTYSAMDGLDRARKKRFGRLYDLHNGGRFHKMDVTIEGDDIVTLIFRKDNLNFANLCTITSKDIYL